MVTPEVAERSGAVAPLVSCVISSRVAVLALCGRAMLSCRFCVRSLFTTMTLKPFEALLTVYAVTFKEPADTCVS